MDGLASSPSAIAPSKVAATPWVLVGVLTVVYAYAFIDRIILALLVEPIKADLHIDDVRMSLLLGLAFAGLYAILNIPAGLLVDRVNRRTLIGVTSVLWASMTIACAFARNFEALFLARAGVGVAEAAMGPAAFSLIRDVVPERSRGLAFSVYAMSPILGGSMALLGGGLLLHAATAGLFGLLAAFSALALRRTLSHQVAVVGVQR